MIESEASIDISRGHLSDRLRIFWYAGLVAPMYGDMYEITTDGMLYLDGDLDASHLPKPLVDKILKS